MSENPSNTSSQNTDEISGPMTITLEKDQVLCLEGEQDYDLYIIHSGELMVCVNKGTQITPLAYLKDGEYLGELSFFDHKSRSAHVIALEHSTLIKIPVGQVDRQFPDWLLTLAKSLTSRLRKTDEVIRNAGIKRQNVESLKPLSMEEQHYYLQLLEKAADERGLPSPRAKKN